MKKKSRKNKKLRGSGTHGYGSKKKHRGGGSRGGRGFGGSHKHKFSLITAKIHNHFGYRGFSSRYSSNKIINVGELENFNTKDINLAKMGYDKLLAKGDVKKSFNVKINKASASAKKKIEEAGGKVVNEDSE